jgi:hypothetical protein
LRPNKQFDYSRDRNGELTAAQAMDLIKPKKIATTGPATAADRRFALHRLNRDWTNFAMIRYRDFQGFLVTGQNSGTHWLKYMLSLAMAAEYGVEPPQYINNALSNDIIGHPKHKRKYAQLPRIASAHSIPHAALPLLYGTMAFPPYVVLVRDMRDALISNYVKWRERYQVPFDVYVEGDPGGKRYVCDAWWYVRFLNAWGRMATRYPDRVMVMRYEDLRKTPAAGLGAIAKHFGFALSDHAIETAVQGSSKSAMMARENANAHEKVIRVDSGAAGDPVFGPHEIAILARILKANLHYDFGYDYGLGKPKTAAVAAA